MFLKGFLKKAAALLCLGSFIPVVPGWCGLERYVPSGRAGGGFGWEWSFWLAVQAISPEWACRLLGERGFSPDGDALFPAIHLSSGDLDLTKPSIED
ncbi:MAG: hypothetical protein PHF93_08150 [Acidobacteriota bacterium]|nr:hypothetical protein [Acidobacteriota bacterium]